MDTHSKCGETKLLYQITMEHEDIQIWVSIIIQLNSE